MNELRLQLVPFQLVPHEARLLLCTAPAGFPSPAADDLEEPIDLGSWLMTHPAACYVMRVDGDSMLGAGIVSGDLVVVNRAKTARAGNIVVALVAGDRTLKRLARSGGRLWLVAEAQGYRDILVDEDTTIWGVVEGLARQIR